VLKSNSVSLGCIFFPAFVIQSYTIDQSPTQQNTIKMVQVLGSFYVAFAIMAITSMIHSGFCDEFDNLLLSVLGVGHQYHHSHWNQSVSKQILMFMMVFVEINLYNKVTCLDFLRKRWAFLTRAECAE